MRKAAAATFLTICALGRVALAQDGSGYNVDDLSRDGFVPAPAGEAEVINGGSLLLAAYVALWLLTCIYVLRLVLRQRAVAREMGDLAAQIRDIDDRLAGFEGEKRSAK